MSQQTFWAKALLEPDQPCPAGLHTWNDSDPAARFAVYRNNVIASLVDALADSFPVTQALVGTDFFRAMAREFVRISPPSSPVLACYGQDFSGFIARFPPAATLPYLADIARLEMAYIESFHAQDRAAISPALLQAALADQAMLPLLRITLHPSLKVVRSPYAIVSLWAAHQQQTPSCLPDPNQAENAWLVRNGLVVKVMRMAHGDCNFVETLAAGLSLGDAVEAAQGDDFDLARCLGLLLREQIICDLSYLSGESHDTHS